MSKVSKNQRQKKPEANKLNLDPRNWQASNNSTHVLLYAETYEEAERIGKSLLGIKKDEAFTIKPYKNNK